MLWAYMESVLLGIITCRNGQMSNDKRTEREPAIVHLKGNSRTRKHRLAELQTEEAEKEIEEYANQPIQDTIR